MEKVFVYGTLKQGHSNNSLLGDSKFICSGKTVVGYPLYDTGPYPVVLDAPDSVSVKGELYEVDEVTFARLDQLEGYPDLYTRKEVRVKLDNGFFDKGWMYFGGERLANSAKSEFPKVCTGEWLKPIMRR